MSVEVSQTTNSLQIDGPVTHVIEIVEQPSHGIVLSETAPNEIKVVEQAPNQVAVTVLPHTVEVTETQYFINIVEGGSGGSIGSISYGTPVAIGTANAEGAEQTVSRSDHVHDHGQQTQEDHHAIASPTGHGFLPRSNFAAATNPAVDDDSGDGYQVGSRWVNTTTDEEFVCLDASAGAAVWESTTASGISLTSTAPVDVDAGAAVVGVATDAARADHKHDIATDTAVGLDADSTDTEGSSDSLARADHTHSIDDSGTLSEINAGDAGVEGAASGFSRKDHQHAVNTGTPVDVGTANAEGSSTDLARADHVHDHGTQSDPTHHAQTSASGAGFQPQSNRGAVVDPGVGDDSGDGYAAGSYWVNTNTNAVFFCLDASVGAAVWEQVNGVTDLATLAPEDVDTNAAAVGVSARAAREDHKHDIATDAAVGLDADSTNTEGSSTAVARADHTHAIDDSGTLSTIQAGDSAVGGTASGFARKDHQHAVETAAPVGIGTNNSEGVSSSLSRADHVHDHGSQSDESHHAITSPTGAGFYPRSNFVASSDPDANDDNTDGYLVGSRWVNTSSGEEFVCVDSTATAAVWISTTDLLALLTSSPPTDVNTTAAQVGVSNEAARADHKHSIDTAAAIGLDADSTNTEGSSVNLARADHTHAIDDSGTLSSIQAGVSSSDGSASGFSRKDHRHLVSTAAPLTIGTTNIEGSSNSLARADHQHAHGVQTDETLHALVSVSGHGFFPQSNWTAVSNPTVDDDSDDGYVVGSRWVNAGVEKEFVCVDNTVGAAVWIEATGSGGGGSGPLSNYSATVDPEVDDDSGDGYEVGSVWVNLTTDEPFILVDETLGAAVWQSMLGGGGAYLDLAAKDSGDSDLVYGGRGSGPTSGATWQIQRLQISTLTTTYADGDMSYDNVWDDREILSYS